MTELAIEGDVGVGTNPESASSAGRRAGDCIPFMRGDESKLVRGVKSVGFEALLAGASLVDLCLLLKTEDAVLVELAEPTSLARSALLTSRSS